MLLSLQQKPQIPGEEVAIIDFESQGYPQPGEDFIAVGASVGPASKEAQGPSGDHSMTSSERKPSCMSQQVSDGERQELLAAPARKRLKKAGDLPRGDSLGGPTGAGGAGTRDVAALGSAACGAPAAAPGGGAVRAVPGDTAPQQQQSASPRSAPADQGGAGSDGEEFADGGGADRDDDEEEEEEEEEQEEYREPNDTQCATLPPAAPKLLPACLATCLLLLDAHVVLRLRMPLASSWVLGALLTKCIAWLGS